MQSMKHSVQFILIAFALCSALPAVFAASSVEKALEAAKIMPKGYAFRVTDNNVEATVQTYQSAKSPLPTDMKIDAVLIGKVVLEQLPNLAKVKVQFYRADNSGYSQVLVTAADISAYGHGDISKEKLLQGLDLTTVGTVSQPPAGFQTATIEQLRFFCPSNWTVSSHPPDKDGYLGLITIPGASEWANILIRKQFDASSVSQQADWDRGFAERSQGAVLRLGQRVVVGRTGLPGYELLLQFAKPNNTSRLHQHIYFGKPHAIYSMMLDCSAADASNLGKQFTKMVSTLEPLR